MPRRNTARSPMSSSMPEDIADESRDHRRAGASRTTRRTSRALHDAGDAHHRAARVHVARKRRRRRCDSIKAGATFDKHRDGARARPLADSLLGTFAKDKVADPAVAEAAFALQANEVSDVVDGAFGPVLVRVTAIKPRSGASRSPRRRRKSARIWRWPKPTASCSTCTTATRTAAPAANRCAKRPPSSNLKVVTVDAIDRAGQRPDGTVVNDLPQSSELLERGLRDRSRHREPGRSTSAATAIVFYEVEGITPARDRTLDEVQGQGRRRLEGGRDREAARRQGRRTARSG